MSGDTRKVSAYPQVSSYAMNLPLMKRAIETEQYKTWAKKSMSKRDEKSQLLKVESLHLLLLTVVPADCCCRLLSVDCSPRQVEDIIINRQKARDIDDVEALLLRYQLAQRHLEKNTANLTDQFIVQKQMAEELARYDRLPSSDMKEIQDLWDKYLKPTQTKLQALCVLLDPRIWEAERKGDVVLDDAFVKRAEIAFDELVNKSIENTGTRNIVNKTWFVVMAARKARINNTAGAASDSVFCNVAKINQSNIIGPWQWWQSYAGAAHKEFTHHIARVVLNLRCNAAAVERVNSMFNYVIGLRRNRMENERAEKLVYIYVNIRALKSLKVHMAALQRAEAKKIEIFKLPKLDFETGSSDYQDPDLYNSLGDNAITSVGVSHFEVDDHLHQLFDVFEGLDVVGTNQPEDATAATPAAAEDEAFDADSDDEAEECCSDVDEGLDAEALAALEEIEDRQRKRARGDHRDPPDAATPTQRRGRPASRAPAPQAPAAGAVQQGPPAGAHQQGPPAGIQVHVGYQQHPYPAGGIGYPNPWADGSRLIPGYGRSLVLDPLTSSRPYM